MAQQARKWKVDATGQPLLLLIDSGATHTRALLTTVEGAIRRRGTAGPSNAYAVSERVARANLQSAVRKAFAANGAARARVVGVVVGGAGIDFDGSGTEGVATDLRRAFPRARLRLVTDAVIALEGALAGGAGAVIVSGTGSIVVGKDSRGRIQRLGGWGWLLGDEGSGQWIGREALRAAARAVDRAGPATPLARALARHYHVANFRRVIDPVYRHPSPAEFGALAPFVARLAAHGDRAARDIFQRAGAELGEQAATLLRRLGLHQPKVSYQGSLFRTGRLLFDPLRKELRSQFPRARLIAPILPPIGGAFLMGLAMIGTEPSSEVIHRFERSLHA